MGLCIPLTKLCPINRKKPIISMIIISSEFGEQYQNSVIIPVHDFAHELFNVYHMKNI